MPASRKRYPLFAFALLLLVIPFGLLGRWQLERAAENDALRQSHLRAGTAATLNRLPHAEDRFRRARLTGRFAPVQQVLLDNLTRGGRAGYEVLTPFVLSDGGIVLVNRGWILAPADRATTPDVRVEAGPTEVEGRFDRLPRAALQLGEPSVEIMTSGVLRSSFPSIELLASALRLELAPLVLKLDAADSRGYQRDWPEPGSLAERNQGYAVQWFALALAAAAGAVLLAVGRKSTPGKPASG